MEKTKDCPLGTAKKCSQRVLETCLIELSRCYMLDCVERMLDEEVAPYAREQEAKKDAENENGNEGK